MPAEHVAAIIIEPVQGEGGFVPAPAAYLRGLREICDEHGILLICDEVQSGFCRTGRWAAYEHAGIVPDLSTWAKSMGGGLPIAAVIGRAEVMDAAAPGTIGGTYGGNPVACAAALATIAAMEPADLNARGTEVGRAHARTASRASPKRTDLVGDVRGLGAMMAMELCHGGDPDRPAGPVAAAAVARCREPGVLVLPAGPDGNVIRIAVAAGHLRTPTSIAVSDVIEQAVLDAADSEGRRVMKPFAIAGMQLDALGRAPRTSRTWNAGSTS